MERSRKRVVLCLLISGLGFISLGWLAETFLFMDLGGHSTNSQAFDVIRHAVEDGKFVEYQDENEMHNVSLWVANDATRAVMSSVRLIRSMAMWVYLTGWLLIVAGGVVVSRTFSAITKNQSV